MTVDARAWCYYRNLVQTVYREIRHVGGPDDEAARLVVDDDSFARSVGSIKSWRPKLKGTTIFDKVADKTSTVAVRKPYEEVTHFTLDQLCELFARSGWTSQYGGEKWRRITALAMELGDAIDADDNDRAIAICDQVYAIRHNSGPLVPHHREDHNREKWPVLCDPFEESA